MSKKLEYIIIIFLLVVAIVNIYRYFHNEELYLKVLFAAISLFIVYILIKIKKQTHDKSF